MIFSFLLSFDFDEETAIIVDDMEKFATFHFQKAILIFLFCLPSPT